MERLYDYCVSYSSGSIGIFGVIKQQQRYWLRGNLHMVLIGQEDCITPSSHKHPDFAISTIVYLPSWNY
jgi:hypothetical protein